MAIVKTPIAGGKYQHTAYVHNGEAWIAMDGNYYAADLCCPNCVMKKPVEIDGLYAVCPKCGEHYDLSYGYAFPTKGFTQYPLRKYPTILYNNASGYSLRITN
jgi:nitrite reductase/ring-hydroxylating ferredoxin subunit